MVGMVMVCIMNVFIRILILMMKLFWMMVLMLENSRLDIEVVNIRFVVVIILFV